MQKTKELISVIMPTFNEESYLQEAISSVLDQTYPNIELIIVDNMSIDNTLEIIKVNKSIDMSDPKIADEFTRFMKESDPKGFKDIEEKVILESFNPKGRKKNASGGRVSLSSGGVAGMLGE